MKKYIRILIASLLLSWGGNISAQTRVATTTSDATQLKLAAYFSNFTVSTISNANTVNAIYALAGGFSDPSSKFDATQVNVGMHFIDASCNMYKVVSITAASALTGTLSIRVSPVGAQPEEVVAPDTQRGIIFDPTPNMLLPQWIYDMPSKIANCLLSHMANAIDMKLKTVSNAAIVIKNSNYTLASNDDTVLFDATAASAGITLTLPSASANNGKAFKVGKIDDTANVLNFSPSLKLTTGQNMSTLNYARTLVVQSDGTNWWIINQY